MFANEDSCLRLVSAVIMEILNEWRSSEACLSLDGNNGWIFNEWEIDGMGVNL